MNKRIKNKLKKRLGCRHYCDLKMTLIVKAVKQEYPDADMIVVSTSKSGKNIEKVTACFGVVPSVNVTINHTILDEIPTEYKIDIMPEGGFLG